MSAPVPASAEPAGEAASAPVPASAQPAGEAVSAPVPDSAVPADGAGGLAERVVAGLAHAGLTVATAESLTAGLVAARLADVPGASAVLRGGVVSYATAVKRDVLGVDGGLLEARGAVDPDVAAAMAVGACRVLRADVGLATTGVAGPAQQDGKAVGTVFVALAGALGKHVVELHLTGDRAAIRRASVNAVLGLVARELGVCP